MLPELECGAVAFVAEPGFRQQVHADSGFDIWTPQVIGLQPEGGREIDFAQMVGPSRRLITPPLCNADIPESANMHALTLEPAFGPLPLRTDLRNIDIAAFSTRNRDAVNGMGRRNT